MLNLRVWYYLAFYCVSFVNLEWSSNLDGEDNVGLSNENY